MDEPAWKLEVRESVEKIPPAEEGFAVKSVREDRESH